jgi:hypothetical protein
MNLSEGLQAMPYLTGVLTGVLLTMLVLFLVDHVGNNAGPRVVNWDVLGVKLGASVEQVRQDVHEATAPNGETSSPPAPSGEAH